MTLKEHLAEAREWLKTYGGKLSVIAAGIGTPLVNNALVALGFADYVPEGWPRGLFLIALGAAIVFTPMKAAKKDAASASAE